MTGTAYRRSAELAGDRRPVRRVRPQRRRAPAGHAQAPGGQRRAPHGRRDGHRRAPAGHQGVGRRRQDRREERLPQRAGLRARADRHDRLHDGLRHDRHRAGLLAGQVQEAGRRRVDADRQPDDPAGAEASSATPRRPSRRSSSTSPSNGHVIDAPGLKPEHYEVFDTAMGARADQADGPRADDGGRASRSCPARSPRRSTCRRRRRSRRSPTSTSRAGSSASRRSRSTATTARSASRCPTRKAKERRRRRRRGGRRGQKVVEYRPIRKRLPKRGRARRPRSPSVAPRAT